MAETPAKPNFEALTKWIEKLEDWCDKAGSELDRRDQMLAEVEEEQRDWAELEEWLCDVQRGVRTLDEVIDKYVPSRHELR